ncbi:flagellin [Roseovarius sp. LXJ103]|uniref:flagellin N-terminal helical domain-containing protein n=1 Tax=Roseovarius carneus TaxID=2853164 RepID=UPI000D61F812|nr:flagellin [Roseovarius carneus]MBZ8117528.1 flagellin [Roseovarius carneus]PWE36676.1 flagellin [Pelagicola sp. LXJ1103]
MSSILTNNSAMVALQTLKSVNSNLAKTQDMISTGLQVGSAKDNSAIWAISKVMESDLQGFQAVSQSLSLGESTVAVARMASEKVTDDLKLIKEEIVAAQDGTVDRATLQERIDSLVAQIQSNVDSAQVNGVNLVNGSATAVADVNGTNIDLNGSGGTADAEDVGIQVISALDRSGTGVTASKINVVAIDLTSASLEGADGQTTPANIALEDIDVTTTEGATRALNAIEGMIDTASTAAATFGSVESRMESQSEYVSQLSDAIKSGIGNLVDANMEETSARLQALQVQQQLATQSLSIANQAPQAILSLFR